jgi:hypothetical protein
MAIDAKHLPDDPTVLQKIGRDLAQLDRESAERHKIEAMLRELLDARRNRKSEQLSVDQLALFAAAWEARQATEESNLPRVRRIRITIPSQTQTQRLRRRTMLAGSHWPSISSASASCMI